MFGGEVGSLRWVAQESHKHQSHSCLELQGHSEGLEVPVPRIQGRETWKMAMSQKISTDQDLPGPPRELGGRHGHPESQLVRGYK